MNRGSAFAFLEALTGVGHPLYAGPLTRAAREEADRLDLEEALGVNTMTKKELCERVSETTEQPRVNVRVIVQAFLDEVVTQLAAGHRLEFREFGVFEPRTRAARRGRNPKTSAPVSVPAKRTIRFKPGLKIRKALESAVANAKGVGEATGKSKAAGRNAGRAGARQEPAMVEVRRQAGVGV